MAIVLVVICYAIFSIFKARREEERRRKTQIERYNLFLQALRAAESGDFSQIEVVQRYMSKNTLSDELRQRCSATYSRYEIERKITKYRDVFAGFCSSYIDQPDGSMAESDALLNIYEEFYLLNEDVLAGLCAENDMPFSTIGSLKEAIVDSAERVYETLVAQAGNDRQSFLDLENLFKRYALHARRYYWEFLSRPYPSDWNRWVVKYYDDPPLDSFDHQTDENDSWSFITQRLIDAVESRDLVECGIVLAHCHYYEGKRLLVGDVLYAELARVFSELKAEAFGTIGKREAMNMNTE
jgi:hypothetical protein